MTIFTMAIPIQCHFCCDLGIAGDGVFRRGKSGLKRDIENKRRLEKAKADHFM